MSTLAVPLTLSDVVPLPRWRTATLVAGGAALTAAAAQVRIPLGFTPVPLTGQTFAVLLVGASLGARRAAASQALCCSIQRAAAACCSRQVRVRPCGQVL